MTIEETRLLEKIERRLGKILAELKVVSSTLQKIEERTPRDG